MGLVMGMGVSDTALILHGHATAGWAASLAWQPMAVN